MDRATALALPYGSYVQYRGRRIFRYDDHREDEEGRVLLTGWNLHGRWVSAAECEVPPNVRELLETQQRHAWGTYQSRAEAADLGEEDIWDLAYPGLDELPANHPVAERIPPAWRASPDATG